MSPHEIRVIGDPVLRQPAKAVAEIDGSVAKLVEDMFEVMYDAPGVGLAAPQVGIERRIFVYDYGEEPGVMINPELVESSGEWSFVEGCLSVPDLHWEIVRPKEVLVKALDLDGNEFTLEADELAARVFQHELDHLNGVLLVERLDEDQRKEANRVLRERAFSVGPATGNQGLL